MTLLASLFVNLDATLLVLFGIGLGALLYWEWKRGEKLEFQQLIPYVLYMVMYRTKWGLKKMDAWAKRYHNLLRMTIPVIITTGIVGMVAFSILTFQLIFEYLASPSTSAPPLQLVLPIESSATFYIPFFYWILGIFVIAAVHEFAHGVIARYYKMRVKSSGFAFLGIVLPIIPAAFVEPDEKQIVKRPWEEQVAVYAAGPFINVVLFFVLLLIVATVFAPFASSVVENDVQDGVLIHSFANDSALEAAGASLDERIIALDGTRLDTANDLFAILNTTQANDTITVETNESTYVVTLGDHPERDIGYLGFNGAIPIDGAFERHPYRVQQGVLAASGMWQLFSVPELPPIVAHPIIWTIGFLFWTALLSLGIGIFNLLPIFIADGARILWVTLREIFGMSDAKAGKVTFAVGWVFIILILAVLLAQANLLPFL